MEVDGDEGSDNDGELEQIKLSKKDRVIAPPSVRFPVVDDFDDDKEEGDCWFSLCFDCFHE